MQPGDFDAAVRPDRHTASIHVPPPFAPERDQGTEISQRIAFAGAIASRRTVAELALGSPAAASY
jgi:hypothetical protein